TSADLPEGLNHRHAPKLLPVVIANIAPSIRNVLCRPAGACRLHAALLRKSLTSLGRARTVITMLASARYRPTHRPGARPGSSALTVLKRNAERGVAGPPRSPSSVNKLRRIALLAIFERIQQVPPTRSSSPGNNGARPCARARPFKCI